MPMGREGKKQRDREELDLTIPCSVILTSLPDGSADDYGVATGSGPG